MKATIHESPSPGMVRRKVGEIVMMDGEAWRVKEVNDCSAICVRDGVRVVEIKDRVFGKTVRFTAPQSQTVRISTHRERIAS